MSGVCVVEEIEKESNNIIHKTKLEKINPQSMKKNTQFSIKQLIIQKKKKKKLKPSSTPTTKPNTRNNAMKPQDSNNNAKQERKK